jgi:DUF1680 family protein
VQGVADYVMNAYFHDDDALLVNLFVASEVVRWKAGDTIDMVVPQPLRTLSIDTENPNLAALMRGAVMYVGLNPWDGIGAQSVNLPGSLSPLSASGQAYRTAIAGRDLVFVPYFTVDTERYNTYFRIA